MVKRRRFRKAVKGVAGDLAYSLLRKMGGRPGKSRLAELWRQWEQIMGPEIADMARPAGGKGKTLLIMAEDAMMLQDLLFYSEEILQKANEFIGHKYFDNVRGQLQDGRKMEITMEMEEPGPEPGELEAAPQSALAQKPNGKYLPSMEANSPVARCYALFAGKK